MFDQELPVSYYEEISQLNKEHHVSVVRHRETGRICVKKVLSVYDPEVYAALFRRPVKQVPRIYALYEDRGTLTVIEEYISGDSLEEVLSLCGPLPEDEVIRIAVQLCRILAGLHSFDPPIIHRDIKPSNIILTEDGQVVLLDMNAAKFMHPDRPSDTRQLGTPGFAAPEQYGFGSSTTATDLYAVGVLMDLLLTGTPGETAEDISPALKKLIRRSRALDPAQRLSDASELARVLSLLPVRPGPRETFRLKSCPVCGKRLPARELLCPDCGHAFEMQEASSGAPVPGSASPEGSVSGGNMDGTRPMLPKAAAAAALLFIVPAVLYLALSRKPSGAVADHSAGGPAPAASVETSAEASATRSSEDEAAQASAESLPAAPLPAQIPEGLPGSYEGEGGSGLTLCADGTAIYYHADDVYSEPADPWTFEDGRLSITLSKLHCVITADVADDDFSRLVFRSESGNWDEEAFTKLPEENPEYLESALRSFDAAVTVLPDGQMSLTFGGVRFTVPKHYLDLPDSFSGDMDTVILTDVDTDTVYYGNLLFHNADFRYTDTLDARLNFSGFAKEFLYSFYYDVRLTDVKEETIAGSRALTARFTGETNNGFSGATGMYMEGIVAFLLSEDSEKVLRLCFSQTSDSETDRMEELEQILYGAVRASD